VGISELVKRAIGLSRSSLAGIDLRTDLELDGTLRCAPHLMTQVLTNLIENAGHAAGPGGWVEIRGRAEAGQITLEVADSGLGVPLELRDRIFEPFFTTKPPGSGTGLGLSLARDIVHRHGGVLEVRDRGARPVFVMQVPGHSKLDATAGGM
ncbi:MAG: histidine kinase, partial [Deltaproteobacteria bacterium]|nr:histidine kinase [Deltaproteobacteria bacterium]